MKYSKAIIVCALTAAAVVLEVHGKPNEDLWFLVVAVVVFTLFDRG